MAKGSSLRQEPANGLRGAETPQGLPAVSRPPEGLAAALAFDARLPGEARARAASARLQVLQADVAEALRPRPGARASRRPRRESTERLATVPSALGPTELRRAQGCRAHGSANCIGVDTCAEVQYIAGSRSTGGAHGSRHSRPGHVAKFAMRPLEGERRRARGESDGPPLALCCSWELESLEMGSLHAQTGPPQVRIDERPGHTERCALAIGGKQQR